MYCIYRRDTGVDVSWATVVDATVLAGDHPDLLAVAVSAEDRATKQWDPATRTMVARPVVPRRTIDKTEFLRRLTLTTLASVLARESTDPLIAALRVWIDNVTRVDLDTIEVQQGIGYLQQIGVVTAQHAAAILADGAA